MIRELKNRNIEVPKEILNCIIELDRHYIPSRYPDVFSEGAPMDYYSRDDGLRCISCAEKIVEWVNRIIEETM